MNEWRVLNIGNLTRNKFWGEDEAYPHRECVATSTLLCRPGVNILVDPPLPPDRMPALLDARRGMKPGDINIVYITHLHGDHYAGIEAFPDAVWLMAPGDLQAVTPSSEAERLIFSRMRPADAEIAPGVELVGLPGHTAGLAALLFEAEEGRVLVTGDGVMTKEFFRAGEGYYFCADPETAKASIKKAASIADVIVPGHDNFFFVKPKR